MSAKKGKSKKGIPVIMLTFTYMDQVHTMTSGEMGIFFGVGYDKIKRRKCQGHSDQDIADEAAEQGGHKPRVSVLFNRFIRRGLLVRS